MNANEIKVVFTLDQVNAVLGRIGQLPYAQVADLIEGIRAIVEPQVAAQLPQETEKEAAAE